MSLTTKDNPFCAKVIERYVVNPDSTKCTFHMSLDISGADFALKAGDSIGVIPENDPSIVKEILSHFPQQNTSLVQVKGKTISFQEYLFKHANLLKVTQKLARLVAEKGNKALNLSQDELKNYLEIRQVPDFLHENPSLLTPQELVDHLLPLLPRFYSVASSSKVKPTTIDLLVAYFEYETNQQLRKGVASHYLWEIAPMHQDSIPIYPFPSKDFTLPSDTQKDIIMIGPGTGVAPFRAFMQERQYTLARGRNWLFFGERNSNHDFFYKNFWDELLSRNLLKLSLAFSRDQDKKVYVQDKMKEESKEFFSWLEKGAYLYVCGDANRMAKDVERALLEIIMKGGHRSESEARAYIYQMRDDKRYLRDVY